MTLEAIKEAITDLPRDEKARLAAWLLQQDMEEWDQQIEADFSAGGKGMALLEEAEADVREGRVKPMDEFLAEAKARSIQPKLQP
jgi:Arc/MetJ-type ribon-helix-helix transcriptional regulator